MVNKLLGRFSFESNEKIFFLGNDLLSVRRNVFK